MTDEMGQRREQETDTQYAVAIVGMAGRFPGADDLETFWLNVRDGVESVTFFTDEELLGSGLTREEIARPNYVKAKPILSDIEGFDARFFRMSPREAALTDPQHRIFLECAWAALEDAGLDPEADGAHVALYAAASKNTYLILNLLGRGGWLRTEEVYQILIGNEKDYLSSRVSYKLNLRGPSVTVQTACSSSLVAVHMACQSLLNGECDSALAGGVAVDTPHKSGYLRHAGDVLSPDGHCRAFDAAAAGTVFGQGAGVVVLRRLRDALEDGDNIHAVIRGSAVNHDGARKVGFTAPSVEGQAAVIAEALAVAGVCPETVTYVEAHGTATPLGDPVEVAALTRAFRAGTDRRQFCALGSVKTNVGHLNAAAGVAGLIKTVLALKHRQLPPSLHFREPNRSIDFAASPFFVNTSLTDWPDSPHPRRAGVSSFGQGGTNAHVVLEEAAPTDAAVSRQYHFLPVSARSLSAVEEASRRLRDALTTDAPPDIADAAFTLQTGRRHFSHRRAVLCADTREAVTGLNGADPARVRDGSPEELSETRKVFVLHDCAPEQFRIPLTLFNAEPGFRQHVARVASACEQATGLDVEALFTSAAMEEDAAKQPARRALFPLLHFAVQYSLAELLASWIGRPATFVGVGIGELTGACLAGSVRLEDALTLLCGLTHTPRSASDARAVLDRISLCPPDTPLYSASARAYLEVESITPEYLSGQLAREADALESLAVFSQDPSTLLVHLSPREGPCAPVYVTVGGEGSGEDARGQTLSSIEGRPEEGRDARNLITAVADLWLRGIKINWRAFYEHQRVRRVSLPTYPFERRRYWVEPEGNRAADAPDSLPLFKSTPPAAPHGASARSKSTAVAVARIFETTLGVERVGADGNFFELGGDSIMSIMLLRRINEAFGVQLPTPALFERQTVRELAALIDSTRGAWGQSGAGVEPTDLNSDIFLDESIQVKGGLQASWDAPRDIFLTGATGFVGAHLLDELLRRTDARIHCLVRARDAAEVVERIRGALLFYGLDSENGLARIRPVSGDLSRGLLGMSADAFAGLAAATDAVYHCGAQVDFVQSYRALKNANVGGTREVLRFAAAEKLKPVHYVSSIAVFESDAFDGASVAFEDDDITRGDGFRLGYSASKWVAEGIVRCARVRGVPASIYRLSNVAGHSLTGVMPDRHIVARFIKGCLQLGLAPTDRGPVNIIPADTAARMVVELSLRREALGGNFHVVHPRPVPLSQLVEWLQTRGYRLRPCTYEKWVSALAAAPEENALRPFLPMFGEAVLFSGRLYDHANATRHLPRDLVECGPADEQLFDTYLSHLIRAGHVDAPPALA